MSFQISPELDANKVFLVRSSELEGRLDPFCYVPDLVQLDRKIKSKTKYYLKDFTLLRASGATPKKDAEDYYSDEKNGIPFIRVQNLSVTGELDTRDLVYISKDVHEGMLKRSQIKANDLLVKITGVGRMAVASVVPDGFEGNINQHIVVIRTDSKETSQNLAAFLNLDSVEKIASKRATGGTRPALDYAALFSIPVINRREIYEIINKAVSLKREKEAEAQRLLDSIDDYLLGELGIELPEPDENTVQSRIFIRRFSEISGGRFDSVFFRPHYGNIINSIRNNAYVKLGNIVNFSNESWNQKDFFSETFPYIEIGEIDLVFGEVNKINYIDINEAPSRAKMIVRGEDIIISTTRPSRGAIAIIDAAEKIFIASTGFAVIRKIVIPSVFRPYLFHILRSSMSLQQMEQRSSGGNYPAITQEELAKVLIPLPSLEKQAEISDHITLIRSRAKQLQQEAKEGLEQAKRAVEAMLLGDSSETL